MLLPWRRGRIPWSDHGQWCVRRDGYEASARSCQQFGQEPDQLGNTVRGQQRWCRSAALSAVRRHRYLAPVVAWRRAVGSHAQSAAGCPGWWETARVCQHEHQQPHRGRSRAPRAPGRIPVSAGSKGPSPPSSSLSPMNVTTLRGKSFTHGRLALARSHIPGRLLREIARPSASDRSGALDGEAEARAGANLAVHTDRATVRLDQPPGNR